MQTVSSALKEEIQEQRAKKRRQCKSKLKENPNVQSNGMLALCLQLTSDALSDLQHDSKKKNRRGMRFDRAEKKKWIGGSMVQIASFGEFCYTL